MSANLDLVRSIFVAWERGDWSSGEWADPQIELAIMDGPSRVLALVRAGGGRGKTSGLELGQHGGGGAQIFDIRAGKVTRLVTYFNRERGLADLGLKK
jgi:ketosteroid isomerase-like protein